MILNALDSFTPMNHTTDIAIVGSGPAGITLANELAKMFNVLLIEAGGLEETTSAKRSLTGSVSGISYPLTETRARLLGGSSSLWAGYCAQFNKEDFESLPWVPDSGWPFSAAEIMRFYPQAARLLHVEDACFTPTQLSCTNSSTRTSWFSNEFQTSIWRFGEVKADFAVENKDSLAKSTSISVLLNACVTNVHLSDNRNNAVECLNIRTLEGRTGKIKAKTFILATGGIETPRLLLGSRQQYAQGVGNSSGKIGQYFMEHPHVTIEGIEIKNNVELGDWTGIAQTNDGRKFARCFGLRANYRKVHQVLNAKAHLFRSPQMTDKDRSKVGLFFEQSPNPYSCVTLTHSNDALDMPRINLNWEISDLDRYSHQVMSKLIANELLRIGLAVQTGVVSVSDEILYSNHQLGTTRMSKDPIDGVVDANCKAHDLENLYIVGGSVFPTVSWANPTLTVLALTLRLASHINENHITHCNAPI